MNIHLNNLKYAIRVALAASVLVSTAGQAADITVTTFADEINANGSCSLREAIINANANNTSGSTDCVAGTVDGDDVINLPAGTYTLSIPGRAEDSAQTGDLDIMDISGSIVISGVADASGLPATTIDAAGIDRIFDIFNPDNKDNLDQLDTDTKFDGVTITLQNLELINGLADEGESVDVDVQGNGGAVFSWRFNNLTVENCTFRDNQAVWDGMYGDVVLNDPDGTPDTGDELIVDVRTFSGHGGGLYSRGALTVTNSRFIDNIAYTTNDENDDGIIEGEFEKSGNGGGLFTAYTSFIVDSTFTGNTAGNGGGMNTTGGEPAIVPDNMTVTGSTFNDNWSVMGGGLNNVSPQVTIDIINSTFSANTSTDMGAGVNSDSSVYLSHVTVVDNKVVNSDQNGAGINYFGPNSGFTIANTLLSNNKGASLSLNCGCTGGDILACSDLQVVSRGGNISSDFNCGLNTSDGDLMGPDPGVLELADNGGPTQTHALAYDSLAIDNGKDAGCVNAAPAITDDQRGATRPTDGDGDGTVACDTGAYERQVANTDLVLNEFGLAATQVAVNEEVSVSVSVGNTGPDVASSARVTMNLPEELAFVSSESTCSATEIKVTCVLGDLSASGSENASFILKAVDAGELTLDATASALQVDLDGSNNSLQATLDVLSEEEAAAASGSSDGGGFCSYNPRGRMDYVLPALVLIALMSLYWRRYRS